MKQMTIAQFLPPDYEQVLYQQYLHCQQGTWLISEYKEEFYWLNVRNNLPEPESHKITRYVDGLRAEIKDSM